MRDHKPRRNILSLLLAVLLAAGVLSTAAYAAAPVTQKNNVFKSGVFVIKDGRFVSAESAALNSGEAASLRARFDRFYANDLVGVYLTAHTAQIAIKPKDGVAPAIIVYNAATKSATSLKLLQTDKNGFCYFAIPEKAAAPLSLIVSNGKLVSGKKTVPQSTGNENDVQEASSQDGSISAEPEDLLLNRDKHVREVFRLVNVERVKAGLSEVVWDSDFAACAQIRAEEMTLKKGHERPLPVNDGIDWPPNVPGGGDGIYNAPSVANEQGVTHTWIMENGAFGGRTAEEAVYAWMTSPGHRANILTASHVRCGVGVHYNTNPPAGGCSIGWALWFDDYNGENGGFGSGTGGGTQRRGNPAYTLSDTGIELNAGETRQLSVIGPGDSDFTVEWSSSSLSRERLSLSDDGLLEALYPDNESLTSATSTHTVTAEVKVAGRAVATLKCKVKYVFKK